MQRLFIRLTGKKILIAAALAFPLLFGSLFAAGRADAYIVEPGDTLYRIGLRYGVSVQALQETNGISGHLIYPGQEITIPGVAPGSPAEAGGSRQGQAEGDLPSRGGPLSRAKKILGSAASFLGTRYVYGGSSPRGFDCSGFVQYIFRNAGFDLPHNAAAQAGYGTPVEKGSLKPGDLVFFSYYGSKGINHVGIYAGNDQFIHASTKYGVKYSSLSQSYYRQNYRGARRLLEDRD